MNNNETNGAETLEDSLKQVATPIGPSGVGVPLPDSTSRIILPVASPPLPAPSFTCSSRSQHHDRCEYTTLNRESLLDHTLRCHPELFPHVVADVFGPREARPCVFCLKGKLFTPEGLYDHYQDVHAKAPYTCHSSRYKPHVCSKSMTQTRETLLDHTRRCHPELFPQVVADVFGPREARPCVFCLKGKLFTPKGLYDHYQDVHAPSTTSRVNKRKRGESDNFAPPSKRSKEGSITIEDSDEDILNNMFPLPAPSTSS